MTELWDYSESAPPRKWRWSRRKAKRNRPDTPVKPPVNDVPTFPPPPEGGIDHIRQQLDEAIRDTLLKAAENPEPFLELGRALGPLADLYDGTLTGPEVLRKATTEIRDARGDSYGWSGQCTAITTTPDRVEATVEWVRVPLPGLTTRRTQPTTHSDQEHP